MKQLHLKIVGLLYAFLVTSCATKKFVPSEDWSELNGEYYAYSESEKNEVGRNIISLLKNEHNHLPTSFTFEAKKDSAYIYYTRKDSLKTTTERIPIEGKRKKRFIKQTRSWSVIPFFPIFARFDIHILRFGKDESGNLLVNVYYDNSGMILLFGAGNSGSYYYTYKKLDQVQLTRPYFENGKYGIQNKQGQKVTAPIFSYLSVFENGQADIEINGKYGIIDEEGNFIIPALYSSLFLSKRWNRPDVYIASKGKKYGILDKQGKELVPFKYDNIEGDDFFRLYLGNKLGIYVPHQVHIPAIYDSYYGKASDDSFILVFKGEEGYMVDYNGYEYQTESTPFNLFRDFFNYSLKDKNEVQRKNIIYKPNYKIKRKLLIEEEDINQNTEEQNVSKEGKIPNPSEK